MRSFCSGYPGSILLGHGHITLPVRGQWWEDDDGAFLTSDVPSGELT